MHASHTRDAFLPEMAGLFVAKLPPDSPAALAGLTVGELIISVEGQSVIYRDDFLALIRSQKGEGTIRLTVKPKNGPKRRLTIPLSTL